MKKAITLVALAGVAMSAEFEDDNLNVFKSIGNGLKKAGQFVVQHPKIITTAAALLLDDEELFTLKDLKNKDVQEKILHTIESDIHKVKEYAKAHPELVERVKAEIKKYKHDHSALKTDVKHAMEKIAEHPEILAHTAEALKKFHAAHKLQIEADDHELFNKDLFKKVTEDIKKGIKYAHEHPEVVQDGINIVGDIKHKDGRKFIHDGIKTLQDLGFEDEELFNKDQFKKIVEGVKKGIHYAHEHPEVVKDGVNIVKDIKHKDGKKLIHDGIKTLQDLGFDDEELFNKDLLKKIAEDVKKGIHYAHEHPEVVQDGINIVGDIKQHDKRQLIHDAIKTLQDLGFDDEELEVVSEEELFKIGKVLKGAVNGIKKGAEFVGAHPALIKDGVNIVKDIKNKDIKGLVKDGFKTYKDARADEDEEELFKIGKVLKGAVNGVKKGAEFVAGHPALIKDGVNIVKDVKTHNYGQLIKDGFKTYKDIKAEDEEFFGFKIPQYHNARAEDEELFNKDLFKKITEDIKKGIKYAHEHPEVVKDGVNIVKDIKAHDKRQLIHDSIKTLQDLGFSDEDLFELSEEELFKIGNVVKKVANGVKKGVEFVGAHPALIKDGANIVKDIKNKDIKGLVKDGFKTYKDARAEEEDEEELFKLGKVIKGAVNGVKKGAEFVGAHPALIKDGANIVKDIKNKDIKGLVKDGFKTYKDAHADDYEEELFKLGKVLKGAVNGVKKGAEFVAGHPALIKDGVNIVKDVKTHNYGQLIKDGFKTYKDIKADDEEFFAFEDEELFNLKDTIKKGADFITHHPAVIKDGVNIVKDIKHKDLGSLVKDGFKTYKDIKAEDEEFFSLKDAAHKVGNVVKKGADFVGAHPAVIKDGVHIAQDIKHKDVKGLVKDGFKTYKDLGFEDEEFFAFDDEELFQVKQINGFKDLGFEDQTDNALFSLGDLIKDGKKIKEDVKNHNVKDLIKDGVKTVKDVKEVKKFLF